MTQKTKVKLKEDMVNITLHPELVYRRALTMAQTRNGINIFYGTGKTNNINPTAIYHEGPAKR